MGYSKKLFKCPQWSDSAWVATSWVRQKRNKYIDWEGKTGSIPRWLRKCQRMNSQKWTVTHKPADNTSNHVSLTELVFRIQKQKTSLFLIRKMNLFKKWAIMWIDIVRITARMERNPGRQDYHRLNGSGAVYSGVQCTTREGFPNGITLRSAGVEQLCQGRFCSTPRKEDLT